MKFLTDIAATFLDAWDELRVHRTRVFLSLLGVMIAVAAITTVTGLGAVASQSAAEINDRFGGRPASYTIGVSGGADAQLTQEHFGRAMDSAVERYGISYMSREERGSLQVQFPDGLGDVQVTAVDVGYGDMRRVPVFEGAWFADGDADRLAAAVVVNDTMWQQLGSPDLRTNPTIRLTSPVPTDAVIVGVYRAEVFGPPTVGMYVLADDYEQLSPGAGGAGGGAGDDVGMGFGMGGPGSRLVWLPPETGDLLAERIKADLESELGEGVTVDVQRTDYLAGGTDPFLALQIMISVVSSIVLVIGAVGYVNLAIVTVRARIREIGIRRTFGATGSRVFTAVLLESAVGTTLAGVIGIGLAILILQNPGTQAWMTGGTGLSDTLPFPVSAAITGLAVSLGVGIVAGLIPAVIATRVRVIDAIRSS